MRSQGAQGHIVPSNLQRCVTVDVFLPKNLTNLPVVSKFLKETLDFSAARDYLIRNADKLVGEYAAGEAREIYHPAIVTGRRTSVESFRRRLRDVRKRIEGYSIFEVDGAFEKINNGSVIPTGKEVIHRVSRTSDAEKHFWGCSTQFVEYLTMPGPKPEMTSVELHRHPSFPKDDNQRILMYGHDRFHVTRTEIGFTTRRCLTIMEERTLMIRFITKPPESDAKAMPDRQLDDWPSELSEPVKAVLWDTLIVVGCFFARRLGKEIKIEDQIWITYDIGDLWIWQNGKSMLAVK